MMLALDQRQIEVLRWPGASGNRASSPSIFVGAVGIEPTTYSV